MKFKTSFVEKFSMFYCDYKFKFGLTQKDLADFLGVNQSLISRLLNGKREPTLYVLIKLSDYFNITVNDLIYPLRVNL